jgi:hypothetical protein
MVYLRQGAQDAPCYASRFRRDPALGRVSLASGAQGTVPSGEYFGD